jgi:uncharacterized membrane protein YqjE
MATRVGETTEDRSLGKLVGEAAGEFSGLVRKEIELAKLEFREEVAVATASGKVFGIGALCAYLAVFMLSFAAAWALAEVMAVGWAFLIVGVVYAVVAAVTFLVGRQRMREFQAVPEETVESLKEDVQWLKARKNSN